MMMLLAFTTVTQAFQTEAYDFCPDQPVADQCGCMAFGKVCELPVMHKMYCTAEGALAQLPWSTEITYAPVYNKTEEEQRLGETNDEAVDPAVCDCDFLKLMSYCANSVCGEVNILWRDRCMTRAAQIPGTCDVDCNTAGVASVAFAFLALISIL
eukprot:GEMP01055015.1.p1 GENE.GEMP01055015.1~~GEMP01055015.1.p1  ORF type:complete len:155 (+),score=25.19 GEMP01055015.1:53-517(+)